MHSTIIGNNLWLLFCVFNPVCIVFSDVSHAEAKAKPLRVVGDVLGKENAFRQTPPGLRIGEMKSIDSSLPQCVKLGGSELPALQSDGDFVIGGLFPLHYVAAKPHYSYTSKPPITSCSG